MGDSGQSDAARIARELVARIGNGDRRAETELVQCYSRAIMFILSRRCSDPERVRDVHQDTFITVIERLRRSEINRSEALPAFIRSTAINLLIGEQRLTTRRRTDADLETLMTQPDIAPSPADLIDRAAESILVREVIAQLRVSRDRELLRRFYIEEHDKEDICRDLEISEAHFHRVLFRARQRFFDGIVRRRAPDARASDLS